MKAIVMHKNVFSQSAALALLLVPISACARPADQPAPSGPVASSGGITLAVFVKRHEQTMMAADTDGDGRISKAEFVAAAKGGKGDPAKRFARIDTNGDGMLDKTEIDASLAQRFKRLDTNGDGVLSADERAAAHAHGKNRGDGAGT